MRWCAVLGSVILVFAWTGCGSGSKPANVTFSPPSMSLNNHLYSSNASEAQNISATVTDSSNNIIAAPTITYTSSNTAIADVSTDGLGQVCAGTWNSEATPQYCYPYPSTACPPAPAPCEATITAVVSGGPTAKLNVMVHDPVKTVSIDTLPTPGTTCIPLNGSLTFTATAKDQNATNITGLVYDASVSPPVSPFLWVASPATVATTDTSGATCTVGNTCKITAVAAGTATVAATFQSAPGSISTYNVSSAPVTVTVQQTCGP